MSTRSISLAFSNRSREESAPADEELLQTVATDPSALERLYARYAKLVFSHALAVLGSREDAEDLTQEIFLIICEPTGYDSARGSVGAFLVTMVRSRAIDRLRRRGRSARLLEIWHDDAMPSHEPASPFEHASARRSRERVRSALARLPKAQRQVIELAYYRGLSQREIADDLDAPVGTVKSWSRRALIALGRTLEDTAA